MTETPVWPAPAPRPGMWIQHTFRCPCTDPVERGSITDPDTGSRTTVEQCSGCGGTDYVWRIERARWLANHPDPPDAAAWPTHPTRSPRHCGE